jgi:hypothetical protein
MPELNQCKVSSCIFKVVWNIYLLPFPASFAQPLGLVAPGGGLRQLDLSLDDADFIFDAIFSTRNDFQDSAYGKDNQNRKTAFRILYLLWEIARRFHVLLV